MGERLRQGLKLRNKREIGVGPLKGNNQRERLELSHTHGCSKGHSKRTGSHRAHKRNIRQRPKPNQKETFPSTKDNLQTGGSAVQVAQESTYGQGRTMERSNNPEDTQSQRGPPGKKAQAAAGRKEKPPTEAPTPSCSRDREQVSPRRTCHHNMGQGTLENNRRLSSTARTTRKHTCSDRVRREASDRGSKPIQKSKGRSTNANRRARKGVN